MYILGIETSTRTGGAAVVAEDGIVAHYSLNIEVTYSERLMSTIDRVIKDAGLDLSAIDGFAVSIGPGSFTGLRVGLSTVKGLAFATGKPVAAVPTLRALAWNLPYSAYPVCPMLDARKNQVYAALYQYQGPALAQVMEETAISLQELAGRITGPTVFTGEAALLFHTEIGKEFGERALFAPLSSCSPSSAAVAEIGLSMIKSGGIVDPDVLTPRYIRRPEAEVAWEKRQRPQ